MSRAVLEKVEKSVIQSPLPIASAGLVELGLSALLAFAVNSADWLHVSPTLANLDVLVHCGYSLEEFGIDVKRNWQVFPNRIVILKRPIRLKRIS